MSKRLKMICAIASFAVCIAILVFGVYSAREVEYSLSGTINYEINTLFVDVNTSLYALNSDDEKSVNSVPSSMPKFENSLVSGSALPTNIVKLDYSNSDTTIQNGISEEETLAYSDALNLNYGDYIGSNNQAYLFYLVMEIKNYSSEPVSATLDLDNLYNQTTNTVVQPLYTKINIQGKGDSEYSTAYFITALGYDYPSFIQSSNFSDITLTVNAGELVPTDVSNFTFSRSGSNYRITTYNGTDTDIVIPSQYNGANVTAIGNNVFQNSNITSVYIPSIITSVGSNCFQNSLNLTTVNIQPSSTSNLTFSSNVFDGCSSLRSIYLPNNVTSLGSYAFHNCTSLSYAIFAEDSKIINIPTYAFRGCSRLKSIVISNVVTSIESSAFDDCTNIEEVHISSIYDWLKISLGNGPASPLYLSTKARLYVNGELLTEVTALDFESGEVQITEIASYAFRNQSQLVSVTIPDFVTSIGNSAFYNCSSLQSINIPSKVSSIEEQTFYGCSSLKSITIPSSVTSIRDYAFRYCTNIEEVHIDSVYMWLTLCRTFDSSQYFYYQNPLYVSSKARLYVNGEILTEITALDFVDKNNSNPITEIASYAFRNQSQLLSVEIGDSVTSIGSSAFSGCSSLKSITIPSRVTSIGNSAFSSCTNLESVTFGENSNLESIESSAFSGCSSLKSITIPSRVTSIDSYAFDGCTSIYRVVVENATVLTGLTSTSTMGGLLSAINNAGDRLYVLDSIDENVPDYVKNNYTKLALTETVDSKTYYIYKKN